MTIHAGQRYTARAPADNEWDSILIVGRYEDEWAIQPAGGGPTIAAADDLLLQAYTLAEAAPAAPAGHLGSTALAAWAAPEEA